MRRMGRRGRALVAFAAPWVVPCAAVACQSLAGIEDLQLTGGGAPDATADGGHVSDAGSDAGGDTGNDGASEDGSTTAHDGSSASDGGGADSATPLAPDAATDCPGGFLLCDGFESGEIDPSIWSIPNPPTSFQVAMVDQINPFRGAWALHIRVGMLDAGETADPQISETRTFSPPPSTSRFYVRAYFWLSALPGVQIDNFMTGSAADYSSEYVGAAADGTLTLTAYDHADGGVVFGHATTDLPAATWTCLELEMDTAANGGSQLTVDDDASLPEPATVPALTSMAFGINITGPTAVLELYIDEIAISETYVGCAQ
jgi:hypothetical protein